MVDSTIIVEIIRNKRFLLTERIIPKYVYTGKTMPEEPVADDNQVTVTWRYGFELRTQAI